MSASLVGSEMCIRDSFPTLPTSAGMRRDADLKQRTQSGIKRRMGWGGICLLYTSDAADDM
eukprot:5973060-Alexandrium_andersonii.AAC.1